MFIGQTVIKTAKISIVYEKYNSDQVFHFPKNEIQPYGRWQLNKNILEKLRDNTLNQFTNDIFIFNKKNNSFFKDISKIKIQTCSDFDLKICETVAESSL